jgi:hypothetical protein
VLEDGHKNSWTRLCAGSRMGGTRSCHGFGRSVVHIKRLTRLCWFHL